MVSVDFWTQRAYYNRYQTYVGFVEASRSEISSIGCLDPNSKSYKALKRPDS